MFDKEECSSEEDWLFDVFRNSGSFTDIPAETIISCTGLNPDELRAIAPGRP